MMKDPPSNSTSPTPEMGLATASSKVVVPLPSKETISAPAKNLKSQWNTKNLGGRLASDCASAFCAASMVAPVISIIDRSIMENASGRATLSESLKSSFRNLLLRPQTVLFSKPVALIVMLYGGTYLTANALDTCTATVTNQPSTLVTAGTTKFFASSASNIGLCIYKDAVYVKMFGPTTGSPRPVSLPSYALFTMRDCLTIFASFNVPPLLGPVFDSNMSNELRKKVSGQTLAQFAAPACVQLLSTPIHLLGLDLYNRPHSHTNMMSWQDRWGQVRRNWLTSSMARICRIVPAFGIGGTVNAKVRRSLMERLV
ncbi:hypothetical protein Micbo1qcDRAFT_143520 [Microdochium bolleyi]|uniref:Sequence orphan n=1 Tax=Microdochium bolleyi TaxID=196109 RepID=A0A136JDR1_9PEZI|nr:hypothetical protein Micbo1qcDRAFT_143520 [Microdochium bolleyi]